MPARKIGFLLVLVPLATAAGGTTLPFPKELLGNEGRHAVKEVVEDFTLHREIAGLRLAGKLAVFAHLMRHPDFAASLARAAGVLNYTVERRGEMEFWMNDHKGLTGDFEILRATEEHLVLYANGIYKKGIIRIRGRFALAMESSEGTAGGSAFVENSVSGYVRLDPGLADALARIFRPLVARIMEKRMHWFFRKVNDLMERIGQDPEGVLEKLPPDTWQEETARLRVLLKPAVGELGSVTHDVDPRRGRREGRAESSAPGLLSPG